MIEAKRIGFVGVGDMGGPIAHRIMKGGSPTTLWARRAASLEQFQDADFKTAGSLVDLGCACDIIGVCVFGDADVVQTVLGEQGILAGMSEGGLIVIHSTVSIDTIRKIERAASLAGVDVLDAPVSGARAAAIAGRLTIMVGGQRSAFEKALPVLRLYGEVVEHVGPIGSGQTVKVLNNVLGFANLSMAYRAIEIGRSLGLERQAMLKILRASSGGSFNLNILIDRLMPDPAFAAHALTMVEKDTLLYQKIMAASALGRSLIDEAAEDALEVLRILGGSKT